MKFYTVLLLAAAILTTVSASGQQTKVLTADKHNEYGLVYSLPVTALDINVMAQKETLIAGPYANYAKKYLGVSDPIVESGEKWTIEYVSVTRNGAVDTENRYLMQLKPGSTTFISVDHNGMLRSINKEIDDNTARGVVNQDTEPIRYTGKEYLEYVNEDFLSSQSTAKQAEMLAESLMEVRDAYLSLTRGTAETMPVDGKQLELMLSSLKEQQRALTAAFTGCSYKETVWHSYTFIPEEDTSETLFRFSDFKGFCSANDYAGAPVNIRINVTAEGTLPVDAAGKEKEIPKDGVRYVIPGEAQVTLSFEGKTLFNKEMEFAQFGCIFALSPTLFTDKKQPSWATFNPITGGLEELGTLKGE